MALGKPESVTLMERPSGMARSSKRYAVCERVSEDGVVRLATMRSEACYGITDLPTNKKGRLTPGTDHRIDMVAQSDKVYSDYRMSWLVFWVNRTAFYGRNPLRAIPNSVIELPDSSLAVDIEKGRA